MTTDVLANRLQQPTIKRLGLDDGWWFFCPHFLNIGFPLLFIDACLLPEAEDLGLEQFGARSPHIPLPSANPRVRLFGGGVSLHTADPWHRMITSHCSERLCYRGGSKPAHKSASSW